MKRVIAIAFSDLHINDWSKFNQNNERTHNNLEVLSLIKKACNKYSCPAFFCGDLFHKPENMSLELMGLVMSFFKKLDKQFNKNPFKIYGISGNHDFNSIIRFHNNTADKPISWLNILAKEFKFLESIDFSLYQDDNITVYGVPYIDHNIGLNEYLKSLKLNTDTKNILLLHTDYPGAKDTDGSEVGTSENLNLNILDKFDLVLMGHIHKPQRLSKKAYMIGAPLQQRRTDKNCDLGYWLIYNDLTLEFIAFKDFPKFIDVESEEDIRDDGNYYTVISHKIEESLNKVNKLNKKLSKKRLVKRYLKDKGITDIKKESILLSIIRESEND